MKTDPIVLRVFDVVGGPLAVATDDGQLVHDAVAAAVREGLSVVLSFAGVTTIIAAFLHAAVGQFCQPTQGLRALSMLTITDLRPDDRAMLDRVVRNAKAYYADPKAFERAWEMEGASYG
jgi:hypothetical protein